MNEPIETLQKLCPSCGKPTDTDAKFCKYCDFNLVNSEIKQNLSTEISQIQTKNNNLTAIALVGLLAIGIVTLVIYSITGRTYQSVLENYDYEDNRINTNSKNNINFTVPPESALSNRTNADPVQQATATSASGELTRDRVLSLLSGWRKDVTTKMWRKGGRPEKYERMMKDNVLSCKKFYPIQGVSDYSSYTECSPTASVRGVTVKGSEIMEIEVGYKVPFRVTGISKIDENTSYADFVVTFQEGAGYDFYTKYIAEDTNINLGDEAHRILLRLYDDGWRIERNMF